MRTLLVATLAFAPVLLHAQAISPAQPQSPTAPELRSELVAPTPITSSTSTPKAAHRISTGVIAPKLLSPARIVVPTPEIVWFRPTDNDDRKVTVAMIVDEKGVPHDLKVVESAGPELDKDVLDSVAQYRFAPGSVSNVPFAIPVNLTLTVHRPEGI